MLPFVNTREVFLFEKNLGVIPRYAPCQPGVRLNIRRNIGCMSAFLPNPPSAPISLEQSAKLNYEPELRPVAYNIICLILMTQLAEF